MGYVEYVLLLGENARKRHFHEISRGAVTSFVVQLEVFLDDRWVAVVRYDCAHGFAHVDRRKRSGEVRKQELLLPFADALCLADEDIMRHWADYQSRFMHGEWP